MAPKPIGSDDKIPCPTPDHLVMELEKLEDALTPEETEDTWQKFEKALLRFAAVTRGGAHKHVDVYLQGVGIKGLGDKIVRCMLSDRGKLSGVATDFLTSMAPRLASAFTVLIPLYVPPLIKLLARPNKVYLRRAEKSLMTIAQYCPSPAFIAMIRTGVQDKSDTCRRSCGAVMAFILENWEVSWMGNKGMADIEDAMRKMATERDAEVRKIAKGMWETYNMHYADRVVGFTTPLTPTTRKYLDIKPSAGGPSNSGPKRHPLSASTTAPKYPSMMLASGPAGRTVSSSSTSAQIGGSAVPAQQRAVSSGSKLMGSSTQGGFPFPSAAETAGRSTLSRSTSAVVITQQGSTGSAVQQAHRSVSSMDVRGGRPTKTASSSSTSSSALQSMIEPIAQARNGAAGPSRPRVISNVSASDASAATASASGPSTAQTRRANLAAIGQGPMRPARAHSALGNVAEGRETSSATSTPRGNLFGAPVRPNLQARVTSAGFAQTTATSGSLADSIVRPVVAKRVVSAASGLARKPILPAGLQARVTAKQAESKKEEEEERDVFSAAPPKADELQNKTSRQPFKPTSSVDRVTAEQGTEPKDTQLRKATKGQVAGSTHVRAVRQSPQAKLAASPRQPRIKVKPPLPSSTVPRKKPTDTKIPNRDTTQQPGKPIPGAVDKERTPFRPVPKKMATQKTGAALQEPRLSPTPKSSDHRATINTRIAASIPLPLSPTSGPIDGDFFVVTALVNAGVVRDETSQLAEEVPLPESDDEQSTAVSSSATPKRFERHESSRIADLLPCTDVLERNMLLDEECPVVDHSPTPSSSAETIPVEWDSDTLTEDEGIEGDAECEGDLSTSSVTFKCSTVRSPGGKDTLERTIARKLVAIKAESAKVEEPPTAGSCSEQDKHVEFLGVPEDLQGAQQYGIHSKTISSRVLTDKGNQPLAHLPSTPEKTDFSPKRPKVKQLQQFFENLSPPEQTAGDNYNQSSPSRHTSGRARVRMLSLGGTTPTSSPPPRLTS